MCVSVCVRVDSESGVSGCGTWQQPGRRKGAKRLTKQPPLTPGAASESGSQQQQQPFSTKETVPVPHSTRPVELFLRETAMGGGKVGRRGTGEPLLGRSSETANKEVQWHSKVEAGERCVGFLGIHCYPDGRRGVDGRVTVGLGRLGLATETPPRRPTRATYGRSS